MVKKEYICSKGKKSKVIIEDLTIEITKNSTIMLGFAGVGLIGPIITNTLVEQIPDIKPIGFIISDLLPPISVFYSGILKPPFRLYYSEEYNLIIGTCEVPFQLTSAYNDLAKTICNWALSEDVKAREIIIFQGIHKHGMIDDYPVFYATEEEMTGVFEKLNLKKFEKGIITGPEATIINEALTNNLKPIAFFTIGFPNKILKSSRDFKLFGSLKATIKVPSRSSKGTNWYC